MTEATNNLAQITESIMNPTAEEATTLSAIMTDWIDRISLGNILLQLAVVAVSMVIGYAFARAFNARLAEVLRRSEDQPGEEVSFGERSVRELKRFAVGFLRNISFSFSSGCLLALGSYALTHLFSIDGDLLIFCRLAYNILFSFAILSVILLVVATTIGRRVLSPLVLNVIRSSFWVLFALQFLGILGDVIDFMESTKIPFGSTNVTIWTCFAAICTVFVALGVANWLCDIVDRFFGTLQTLSGNLRIALSRVVRILLFIFAVCVALSSVGIDLTVLSVFGGALGVGLGFGLQKIASNYISGFIILIERSVKIGDLVEVAGFRGRISEINTRFTVVRNNDNVECIVPNENFVTSAVLNHTYRDESSVQYLGISVAYGSDVKRALAIMLEEGMKERPRIVPGKRGWSYIDNFGDSGIDLKLGFWVQDPANGTAGLKTQIALDICKRFEEEGIEIPFNQLEINLRKVDAPELRVEMAQPRG